MELPALVESLAILGFATIVVIGGIARLRGRRSRVDRVGDALRGLGRVDGMPPGVFGNPPEIPPRPDGLPLEK